jgi:hypothetical protein
MLADQSGAAVEIAKVDSDGMASAAHFQVKRLGDGQVYGDSPTGMEMIPASKRTLLIRLGLAFRPGSGRELCILKPQVTTGMGQSVSTEGGCQHPHSFGMSVPPTPTSEAPTPVPVPTLAPNPQMRPHYKAEHSADVEAQLAAKVAAAAHAETWSVHLTGTGGTP